MNKIKNLLVTLIFFGLLGGLAIADEKLLIDKKQVESWQALTKKSDDLYMADKTDEAVAVAEQAVKIASKHLAESLEKIGSYYRSEAEYEKAEPIYKRLLQHQEMMLGLDHHDLVEALHGLARVYQSQNKYLEAEVFHKRAIKVIEKSKGESHPDIGYKVFELGALYEFQKKYTKSIDQYLRALKVWEGATEKDEQSILQAVGSLARVYRDSEAYEKAEPYYKRMIAITEKSVGEDSPYMIFSLEQLEKLYGLMGKGAEAERLNYRIGGIRFLQEQKKKPKKKSREVN